MVRVGEVEDAAALPDGRAAELVRRAERALGAVAQVFLEGGAVAGREVGHRASGDHGRLSP
jgi:hypothetical protein